MTKTNSVRWGLGFFLTVLAGAFLGAVGGRLAGVFGKAEAMGVDTKLFGLYLLVGFGVLVAGMSLRRMDGQEIRSAMLGAAAVLISIPLSRVAITGGVWDEKAIGMAGLGLLFFAIGILVAFLFASRMRPPGAASED